MADNSKETKIDNIVKQKDANLTNAGGLSYWHSYDYNKGEGYFNESEYINYGMSEKEREAFRNAGYTFTLSDSGEISGIEDSKKHKLSLDEIKAFVKSI
jgi:hypothetical protein